MLRLLFAAAVAIVTLAAHAQTADKVVVWKEQRKLELHRTGQIIRTYSIALGGAPAGHKTQRGDQKTPEGRYTIDFRNPRSQFYKSLHISYPNAADRAQARRRGVHPGGDIFIHGLGRGSTLGAAHAERDWTLGCIAVTNEEIDEIWRLVPDGTPIEIHP